MYLLPFISRPHHSPPAHYRISSLQRNVKHMQNSLTVYHLSSLLRRNVEKLNASIVRYPIPLDYYKVHVETERFSVSSIDFAKKLHERLSPHLPSFPYPTSARRPAVPENPRKPHSCNSNIRVYKYTPSQYFGLVLSHLVVCLRVDWCLESQAALWRFRARPTYWGEVRVDIAHLSDWCGRWRRRWRGKN